MMQSRLIHTSPSHHLDPERVILDLHSLTTLESQTPTEALWLVWLQKPLTSVFTLLHLVYAIANLVAFLMLLRLLQSALHAYSTLASTFQRLPFLACLSKKRVVSSIKQTTMPFHSKHNTISSLMAVPVTTNRAGVMTLRDTGSHSFQGPPFISTKTTRSKLIIICFRGSCCHLVFISVWW